MGGDPVSDRSGHVTRLSTSEQSAMRRLARDADSVTITYRRTDGLGAVIVGYGDTFKDRVTDADSQLPVGEWLRVSCSTPSSVYADLRGRIEALHAPEEWTGRAFSQVEGKSVGRVS
jgi:hypothetical protein